MALFARVHPARSDREGRAFLQRRIALFTSLTWWNFAALLLFMNIIYEVYPAIRPARAGIINLYGAIGLVALGWGWLMARRRTTYSAVALSTLEIAAMVIISAAFSASGYLTSDQPANVYSAFLWMSFVVFTRVLVIPSSPRRTLVLSAIGILPMIAVAAVVDLGLPQPALLAGTGVFCLVVTVLSTVGSQVIYGLRTQVAEAMQLGQYTLVEKVGEGGMGTVYRARHALLRRPTAIKLLRAERSGVDHLRRFEREVQHTAELTHPNTVAIFDYGHSPDGVFYYVMEYLDGVDLQTLIELDGPQRWERVAHVLSQVAGALAEAHGRGLVHRDIKPHNIILCRRGGISDVAKVVDFGLVKTIDAGDQQTYDNVVGTPAYMAPEAVTSPESVGPASDLYALGAVAYYLLTGVPPFSGKTALEVCLHHVRTEPVPPSQRTDNPLPAELEQLILTCLAKAPAARPASAAALRRSLERLSAGQRWTEEEAEVWWTVFEPRRLAARTGVSSSHPTMTIDLRSRTHVEIERPEVGAA